MSRFSVFAAVLFAALLVPACDDTATTEGVSSAASDVYKRQVEDSLVVSDVVSMDSVTVDSTAVVDASQTDASVVVDASVADDSTALDSSSDH
mgnify:CR=1 FL=1